MLIVGGGIGGLTLALSLHQAGISCRVFEAAPEIQPLGVGINLLPHAMRELSELGLARARWRRTPSRRASSPSTAATASSSISEPRGRFAGYDWPQLSIHRADLHKVLLDATRERLGADAVRLGHKLHRASTRTRTRRRPLHFDDGALRSAARSRSAATASIRRCAASSSRTRARRKYSGVNMWRGVVRWPAYPRRRHHGLDAAG